MRQRRRLGLVAGFLAVAAVGGVVAIMVAVLSGGGGRRSAGAVGAVPARAVAPQTPPPQTAPTVAAGVTTAATAPAPRVTPGHTPPPAHPIPAGWYQISPGAPSDAEVALEVARMQAIEARTQTGFRTAIASVFRDYGLGLACGGVLGTNQLGVANLTLPCGTPVTFRYNGREVRVAVIDRGPYIIGRLWDLTGATAAVLNFPGLGNIEWRVG